MYTNNNLLTLKATNPKSMNPVTSAVAFYGNRTIGTDSFRLLEVSAPGEAHEPTVIYSNQLKSFKPEKKVTQFTLEDITTALKTVSHYVYYPDVDQVLAEKTDEEYSTIKVNATLFGELLVTMGKMAKNGIVEIKIPTKCKTNPIHIYANSHEHYQSENQTAHGLMMRTNKQ